jgi:hypothetical protein
MLGLRRRYWVSCPDGSKRPVYFNVDRVWPLLKKEVAAQFKANIDFLQGMQPSIDGHLNRTAEAIVRVQTEVLGLAHYMYRQSYIEYQRRPCEYEDDTTGQVLRHVYNASQRAQFVQSQMEELRNLCNSGASPDVISALLGGMASYLEMEAPLTRMAIDKTPNTISDWLDATGDPGTDT